MTIKNQNKNISAEVDITQLFDIEVEQDHGEITAVKLTRRDFYNDEAKTTYDLMDYFYTEQEIDNFVKVHLVVYDSFSQLPQNNGISAGKSNYIYLVPYVDSEGVKEGIYKEYVWVQIKNSAKYRTNEADHNDYVLDGAHYNYESLGSTEIDLSQIRQDIANLQSNKLDKTKVIDNLTTSTYNSSDPTALSAKQGKNLQDNKIDKTSIATNLTTNDDTKVLSAKQGKNLQDNKIDKTSIVTNLTTNDDTKVLSAKQGKNLQDNKVDKSSIVDSVANDNVNPVTSNAVFDTFSDILDQLQSTSLLLSSNHPVIQSGQSSRLIARIYGDPTSTDNVSIDFVQKDKQLFKDIATTGRKNSNWTAQSGLTVTTGDNYTTIKSTNSNTNTGWYLTDTEFTGDFEVQFQANITYANNWALNIGFKDSSGISYFRIQVTGWRYFKLGRTNGSYWAKISTDGETWSDMTISSDTSSTGAVKFGFMVYNTTGTEHSIDYKDLVVTTDYVWDTINTVNGVASYTYTGTGEGCLNFKAKYGTLVSETYSILDCFFIDHAITDNNNNTYWQGYSTRTSVGSTGTTVTQETFVLKTVGEGNNRIWTEDIKVEFDLVNISGNYCVFQLYDGTTNAQWDLTTTGHVTVENTVGNPVKVTLNGNVVNPHNANNNKVNNAYRVGFQLGGCTDLTFKDWIMYYI